MRELEIGELRQRDPSELIVFVRCPICWFPTPSVDDEDAEFQAFRLQGDPGSSGRDVRLDIELFHELPCQCLRRRFMFLEVAARDVPDTRIRGTVATSTTEQHAPFLTQNSSRDLFHRRSGPWQGIENAG